MLVGVTVLLAGAVWLLALTQTIVLPVITAGVVAAVASPLVGGAGPSPRSAGTRGRLLLVAAVVLAVAVVVIIVAGISSESGAIGGQLSGAKDSIEGWLKDLGVAPDSAKSAKDDASASTSTTVKALLRGLGTGIDAVVGARLLPRLTALSLFFLLKDGPAIRPWLERHRGARAGGPHGRRACPGVAARLLLRGDDRGRLQRRGRGAGGAHPRGPLVGTIAIVTFLAAYVPYVGAWSAGAFAVLMALGVERAPTRRSG